MVRPNPSEMAQRMCQRPGWKTRNTKPVNLALQGGGSHGAFTWGVLDRLLEDGRISFEAVSGTSAGAMNAVVLAHGMLEDGNDGARQALETFWQTVSVEGAKSPIQRNPMNKLLGDWSLDNSPGYLFFDMMSRMVSPYDVNPLNLHPLRNILNELVDFDRIQACPITKLFISATNVHTGRVRVFDTEELTVDAVLASACLPFLFQAIEIDNIPYWDGGYLGNPVLFPFFNVSLTPDLLLVQINPLIREETPKNARDILNRLNEITFNAALMKEFRAIEFVTRLIDDGKLSEDEYTRVRLHLVHGDTDLSVLGASSKLNAEWDFLVHLRDIGRAVAENWLTSDFENVGIASSVDIKKMF